MDPLLYYGPILSYGPPPRSSLLWAPSPPRHRQSPVERKAG